MKLLIFIITIFIIVYLLKLLIYSIKSKEVEITLDFNEINLTSFNDDILKTIGSFKQVDTDNKVFKVVQNKNYRVSTYLDTDKIPYYYVNCLNSKKTYKGSLDEIKKSIINKEDDINIIKYVICASISLKFN